MSNDTFSFDQAISDVTEAGTKALNEAAGKAGAVIAAVRSEAVTDKVDTELATAVLTRFVNAAKQGGHGPTGNLAQLLTIAARSNPGIGSSTGNEQNPAPGSAPAGSDLQRQLDTANETTRETLSSFEEVLEKLDVDVRQVRTQGRMNHEAAKTKAIEAIEALRTSSTNDKTAKSTAETKANEAETKANEAEAKLASIKKFIEEKIPVGALHMSKDEKASILARF